MAKISIAFVSSELAPFAKTGGLADVSSALPRYLTLAGHDVRVFAPLYQRMYSQADSLYAVDFAREVEVRLGERRAVFSLYTRPGTPSQPAVYFVHCPEFYDRPGIYTGDPDEHLRFLLLCHACLTSCQHMGWGPDILHCNDWQTALIPLLLKSAYDWDRLFSRSKSVLTIHNIGYQGTISSDSLDQIGFSHRAELLHREDLGRGVINLLKTGVLYADAITTVSPTYAGEIQGELGMGLQEELRRRSGSLVGILNGVDYGEWNPETDPLIPFRYSSQDLAGKAENKRFLLEQLGLQASETAPLLGVVSRLTAQKGLELLFETLPRFLRSRDLRLAVLGSGESRLEEFFGGLQSEFPGRVCYYRGYSNELAHLIEAGADIFLMPSMYEPCGLNQMYSLRYGTVPVVRKTGGLADTVQLFDPQTGQGTGVVFDDFHANAFAWALDYALRLYRDRELWRRLMLQSMAQDFSWERQSLLYIELYQRLLGRRH